MSHKVCRWWLGYFLASPLRSLVHNPATILRPFVTEGIQLTPNPFYNLYAYRNFPSDPIPREERRFYAHVFVQMQEMRPPVPGNPLLQGHEEGKRKCPKCGSGNVVQVLETFFAKTSRKA